MKVYRSNRVEALLDALTEVLREPVAGPLHPEPVMVHSRAMAVWLSMRLAERFDGWVGGSFPFPRRFVQELFTTVLGPRTDAEPAGDLTAAFERKRLLWSVLAALPELLPTPPFEELRRYVADDSRGQARFQLAQRIAEVLDRYAVYRPRMVLAWDDGEEDHWQARLWRTIVARQGPDHPPALARNVFRRLDGGDFDRDALPARVCVFGVSTLPPFYVQVLGALSRHVPVHMFALSPSHEYWAELRSGREALRALRDPASGSDGGPLAGPIADQGNPLLASFGAVGRDFQLVLERELDYEEAEPSLYREPPTRTMLGQLQADVLHLRHRGGEVRDPDDPRARLTTPPPKVVEPDDRSITFHACHSPMREVEVLHDQLLDLLSGPSAQGIAPHQVVVLMADVDTYAPLVEAVFERDHREPSFIPYCIADRSVRAESPTIEAFHRLLGLVGSRVTVSEVLDLIAVEAVHTRFEITAEDLDTITEWVGAAGVRWGVDGQHRGEHGQPRYDQNTWRFGLQRLLLGYGLPGGNRMTFAGVLPYDEIEGQDAELLGKLAELCERLFTHLTQLDRPRTPEGWQEALTALADDMLSTQGLAAWEHQQLRRAIEGLVTDAAAAGFDGTIPLPSMRVLVEERLEEERPAQRFLAGGVTFCAMLPMRTIPFEVVCMLGMSDGAFPRTGRTVGFDLMAQRPRPGDRSRRADDRYLFLEALLAARRRVIISYVGQSIQDNADLPPSVVVSELLDVLEESFVTRDEPGPGRLRQQLVLRHPMQPFSPRYFGADADPRLWSYAAAYEDGARALHTGTEGRPRIELFDALLPPPPQEEQERPLPLDRLVRFFQQPAAELLKRRLGINLSEWVRDRSDREPMELDTLEQWKAGTEILEHRLDELPALRSRELLRAMGLLPLGAAGDSLYEAIALDTDPIAAVARRLRVGPRLPNLSLDLSLPTLRLVGQLDRRWPAAMVRAQYGQIRAKHLLDAWIRHLTLCALRPDDQTPRTVLVGRPEKPGGARVCRMQPVPDATERLDELARLYLAGQQRPLLLFPRSSLAYVQALREGKDDAEARMIAHSEWTGRGHTENDDPHLARIFGDLDPLQEGFSLLDPPLLGGDFASLSRRVFNPLLEHLQEGEDE
ncbi:exodeoxyribonuclease V subunit gamma [Paraliomyxa miuraensis]|uniref:exodeoxyribonuclease V subunit gamma n=1 Tax=Paraliomyxa miuraensis TaxID=376150 RepID=UPI00225851A1|nr:exodeoxyribonuclease V subunit gamma [Paraliomyxa miuraensis]MCX4242297.1 exodeoxyribonuclease V subunit gamma [Paraliomyxa miuraensis]